MAMFVLVVDTSLMNDSISSLVRDLDTTVSGVQAAMTLEALVSAAFILIGGIGASLLPPAMQSLIDSNFEGAEQKKVYALVGAAAAIAAAVGPLLGGIITTYLSWRIGFVLEVVVIAIVLSGIKLIRDLPHTGPRSVRFSDKRHSQIRRYASGPRNRTEDRGRPVHLAFSEDTALTASRSPAAEPDGPETFTASAHSAMPGIAPSSLLRSIRSTYVAEVLPRGSWARKVSAAACEAGAKFRRTGARRDRPRFPPGPSSTLFSGDTRVGRVVESADPLPSLRIE